MNATVHFTISSMNTKHCICCGNTFESQTPWHRYCSSSCQQRKRREIQGEQRRHRYCRQCGVFFIQPYGNGRKEHCSSECARKSARESRSMFFKRNPEKEKAYREKTKSKRIPGGNFDRYKSRYPDCPKACQSCGESRVLDIAHKPEYSRNGAWRSKANTTPDKVWILCPTCHALIDRMGYEPESLGLS